MKFTLALLTFFLACTLPAQTLVFDRESVSLDTVPCTFTQSTNWLWKHRQARFWCSVDGTVPVRIDSVYEFTGENRWVEHKSNWSVWPDVCEPGKSYEVLLDAPNSGASRYEFVTGNGQRISVNVIGELPGLNLTTNKLNYNHEQEREGRVHEAVREITNISDVPVTVDSITMNDPAWSLQTGLPFVLKPGEKKVISLKYYGTPANTNASSTLYFYIFHRKKGGLTDMIQGTVYLYSFHAVMLQGKAYKYFGHVKNGDTLRAEFPVRNNGTATFDLKKNAFSGIKFSKDSLKPGESAMAKVQWVVAAASDSFRMELPLFNDVRNGNCTVVFHGIVGKANGAREKSVSPDSMIWVEARTIDLDTVYRSQGTLRYDIRLKNNSSSPVLVMQANTGDGGSYAEYPREPIAPGAEFTVRFVQDLHYKSVINRGVYIHLHYLDAPGVEVSKVVTVMAVIVNDTK